MTVPDQGLACNPASEPGRLAYARAQAAAARAAELRQQTERLLAEARIIQRVVGDARQRRSSPSVRTRPQEAEYARLLARLETMPVIEQAKGIIMAQSRCGEAEAFDMLRRASQRSNVPVRDLAARIVAQTAAALPGRAAASGPVTPRRPAVPGKPPREALQAARSRRYAMVHAHSDQRTRGYTRSWLSHRARFVPVLAALA